MTVCDSDGLFLGRADFGYRRQKVLGEFDGKVKYQSGPLAETLAMWCSERSNERTLLRAAGWAVVRWVWADLTSRPQSFTGCGGRWTSRLNPSRRAMRHRGLVGAAGPADGGARW